LPPDKNSFKKKCSRISNGLLDENDLELIEFEPKTLDLPLFNTQIFFQ
jgi:hypothetical protein